MSGVRIEAGPAPWQVLQRGRDGAATVELAGACGDWFGETGEIEVRAVRMDDGSPLPGCEWRTAPSADGRWTARMTLPTGGPYRIETRMIRSNAGPWSGGAIPFVFVGDVWVLGGQSNSAGYGYMPYSDPPSVGVSLFHSSGRWQLAAHPLFDATDSKYPANRDPAVAGVSPWLAFGKKIVERTGVPVGLIPAALGGSALAAWEPGEGESPGGALWENMCRMIDDSGGAVAGLVWYQGESDAGQLDTAGTYLARFERFVAAFRGRYGDDLPVLTAQLNRCISSVWVFAGWKTVTEAQRQAAKRIPRLQVVPTLDLELEDIIHTAARESVILGLRFADAALAMVYGKGDPERARPADVRRVRFEGPDRKAIRVEFQGVVDRFISTREQVEGFGVFDQEGAVPVAKAAIVGKDAVLLELGRPAAGDTRCQLAPGAEETTTLRDGRGMPPLAFYDVPVEG